MSRAGGLAILTFLAACGGTSPEPPPDVERTEPPVPASPPGDTVTPPVATTSPTPPGPAPEGEGPLTFALPRRGGRVDLVPAPPLTCPLRVERRSFDFPAGAIEPVVSITGKTMCFHDATFVHCHTSGTGTGLCEDTFDNVVHALTHPATIDGDFVIAYVAAHRALRVNVSGHSQGAYDASRVAPLLRAGDQLSLLQTPSSALVPNEALTSALARKVRVYVVWSPNDNASLGIRLTAGQIPLVELPRQDIERVHNAPNARDQMHAWFRVPEDRTVNPALDASILSNPGSPYGPWRFPVWAP